MRPPTPREQVAIMGASYALMFLGLRAWDHLTRWRAEQRAETEPARLLRQPGVYRAPDGTVFIGPPDWITVARSTYGAGNPSAN